MKLKTLALTALITVVALTASTHAGKYVSVNAGLVQMKPRLSQMTDTVNNNAFNLLMKKNRTTTQANILFGCEKMHSENILFGGELSLGTTFGGSNEACDRDGDSGDDAALKVRQQWKMGIYGLVGTPLSDKVTLYGKLGLVRSRFSVEAFAKGGAAPNRLIKTTTAWGVEPGARVKVALTENISADLDINYAIYRTSTKNYMAATSPNTWDVKMSPRMFGITAGVSYKL
jgi:opacity protein-like surface antigen